MDKKPAITHIIIPTINEYENLKLIIPKLPKKAKILIVDDGSTDKTFQIPSEFPERNIRLIERKGKKGIISAIIDGMKFAVKDNANYIAVMDGDGQHDPSELDKLERAAIKYKADLVIGSRYISQGSRAGFNKMREIISSSANLMFKLNFNFPIHDATSGYRVYSKRLAEFLINEKLKNSGYAGQVEIVKEAFENGFIVREVPITFRPRKYGKSKLSLKEIANYALFTLTTGPLWKYLIVGIIGIFVNEGVLYLLSLYISYYIADIIAIETSIASNFFMNEFWTFKSRKLKRSAYALTQRFAQNNIASLAGMIINYLVFVGLVLMGLNILLANLIGILIAFFARFVLSSTWVWKQNISNL